MKKTLLIICLIFIAIASRAQIQQDLALKYLVQLPAEKSASIPVIILLHGYGSNEADLFGLKEALPKKYLVVSARAPYTVGTQGYQWFDINESVDQTLIDSSRELITKFISQIVRKYKANPKEVYIIGFSQGAMMCYETGLYNPTLVKGIGVLSGRMPPSAMMQNIKYATPELKKLKVFIAHGTADNRIKFEQGAMGRDYVKRMGLKPEFHEYKGMGHSISNDVLRDLVKWLQ